MHCNYPLFVYIVFKNPNDCNWHHINRTHFLCVYVINEREKIKIVISNFQLTIMFVRIRKMWKAKKNEKKTFIDSESLVVYIIVRSGFIIVVCWRDAAVCSFTKRDNLSELSNVEKLIRTFKCHEEKLIIFVLKTNSLVLKVPYYYDV